MKSISCFQKFAEWFLSYPLCGEYFIESQRKLAICTNKLKYIIVIKF